MSEGDEHPERVVGIVLAGGASRRFGADKLLADLDGRSVLDHAIHAVARVADRVVVAGRPEAAWDIDIGDRRVAVRAILDPTDDGGPLVGLDAGLSSLEAQAATLAVVIGGDMPRVSAAVLARLVDRLRDRPAEAAVLLEHDERRPLPLAVRVPSARRAVARCLSAGRASLLAPLDRLDVVVLPEDEWRALDPPGQTLLDVDRPEDLEALRRA